MEIEGKKKPRPEYPTFRWKLGWTTFHVTLAFTILTLTTSIPPIDTESETYRVLFKRSETYDTTYFSPGNLVYYWIMNVLGFLSINFSNVNMYRRSMFWSQHESNKDFYLTIIFAPIFFFLGNNILMRSEQDLNVLGGPTYSYWDCMWHNFGLWTFGYIAGLQFTHLDFHILRQCGKPKREWPIGLWVFTFTAVALITGTVIWGVSSLVETSMWLLSLIVLTIEVIFFVTVTGCLRKTHYLHLHHYAIGMLAIPLVGVQASFLTFVGGYVNGVMIEGAGRWGYDPIWNRRRKQHNSSNEEEEKEPEGDYAATPIDSARVH